MSDSGTISTTIEVPAVRVILADDIVDSRMLLRSMLDCVTGVEVVGEAADERQAVDTATATGADAVFLDPAMPPVMDGLQAATAIRADHPDVKIISCSGGDRASTGATGVAAGADEHLPKAFTVQQLLAQLRHVFPGRALAEKTRTDGRPPQLEEQPTGQATGRHGERHRSGHREVVQRREGFRVHHSRRCRPGRVRELLGDHQVNRSLEENQTVTDTVTQGHNGPQATDVTTA